MNIKADSKHENWEDTRSSFEDFTPSKTQTSSTTTTINNNNNNNNNIKSTRYRNARDNFQIEKSQSQSEFVDCNEQIEMLNSFILHRAIFEDDEKAISTILRENDLCQRNINRKDIHGNTPLHLACMLGRSPALIQQLLDKGASVETKNLHRWPAFAEAVSYGNREIIGLLTKKINNDVQQAVNKINRNEFSKTLAKVKNCKLTLKWEFQSWIPFVSRYLPSDVCVIHKHGGNIRIDTKLLDFEMLSWKQGDSYLICSEKYNSKWIVVDNKTKRFKRFDEMYVQKDIETKIDNIMSSDIIDIELKSKDINLSRSTRGWIWRADKTERIGEFDAALYNFTKVCLVTRKRREHLSDEDLKRNKAAYKGAMDILKFGKGIKQNNGNNLTQVEYDEFEKDCDILSSDDESVKHRESLHPPPKTNVTWNDYIEANPGEYATLGRELKIKTVETQFKASVAISQEFPMTKSDLFELLSIIPLKHFKKLQEFVELKLPNGFPVRLDIPIFAFLTARITFADFAFIDGPIDESLFSIPSDYIEDENLFMSLAGKFSKD